MTTFPDAQNVVKTGKTYARDLTERVLSTFLEGFVAGIVVTQPLNVSMWHAAAVGGVAAAGSLVKGWFAKLRDVKNSASLAKGV